MRYDLEKLTPFLWKRGPNYLHWCPGCKEGHVFPTKRVNGPNWTFNGNPTLPSFTPSMLIYTPAQGTGVNHTPRQTRCHYFLTDGMIIFQPDSGHALKRGSFPLQAIPEDYGF